MFHLVISIGKQYKGLYVVIGMVIINIIFNIFLIPRYGLVGASISTVFTEFFATIFWIIFTKNYLKNFPFLTFFKIILINIICIIFMKFILYEYLILKIFGFLVIQMFLLIMFRVFSKEEISEFRTSIKQ
jgi:O-antigen/teichoic acid export membrane protein